MPMEYHRPNKSFRSKTACYYDDLVAKTCSNFRINKGSVSFKLLRKASLINPVVRNPFPYYETPSAK